MMRPTLILDAATGRLWAFGRPLAVIRADAPPEVTRALARMENARAAGHFVAGYFSYELGYALEPRLRPLMPTTRDVPLLWFGVFEAPEAAEEDALASWCTGRAYAGPLAHEWDEDSYGARFARVRELIAAGDFYQANLTFRSRFRFVGDALALYRDLREQSAARYGAYLDDGERQILSLSPELFFDLAADGTITARPMKGTAPRGSDAVSDVLERQALAESTKNRAENLMIVDLLRNDLGRIAETGSVGVRELFAVETYPTLHQMVSTVTARLRSGTDVAELVRALFPCGSVTGAPKIHAMEVIRGLEQSPRGVYCGAIGHFAPDGSARFNVAIRTLTIAGGRGELGIGGAVVQDSDAAGEYAECLLKARYYEAARRPLELIETLRWSQAEAFVRLDLHLARMRSSAEVFGIPFDEIRAREALCSIVPLPCGEAEISKRSEEISGGGLAEDLSPTRLALGARRPPHQGEVSNLRLRLVLNENGEFACTAAPLDEGKRTWTYAISPHRVPSGDLLARHKTNWRDLYDFEVARFAGQDFDEVIFLNERGEVAEGSRTNVFVRRDGRLLTPPLSSGVLDGVLRRALIDEGRCCELPLTPDDLAHGEVFLGNSLRGLIAARPAMTIAAKPPLSPPGRRAGRAFRA